MLLDPLQIQALGQSGYFVIDDFLAPDHVGALACLARQRSASFAPAGIRRGAAHQLDSHVRSDLITWLDEGDEASCVQLVFARLVALRDALNRDAWLGLRKVEVQLAHYPPNGSHYDRHLDAFPGSDNRRVSVVVYLNQQWLPDHGGCLRLHLDTSLDIEPVGGRAVVFLSEKVEHEVLPVAADRFAIAAWYSR